MAWAWVITALCALVVLLTGYLYRVNKVLDSRHPAWAKFCSQPWTREDMWEAYEKCKTNPTSLKEHLPPKLSRRYIVFGGSGV